MEIVVIVAIVSVVAAIGVPKLHRSSESAVLRGNANNLASLASEEMLQGLDSTYHQAGQGSPEKYLSNRLEYVLEQAEGAARYVNPLVDGGGGDSIVNSTTAPADVSVAAPAVFITDNPTCSYETFDSKLSETSRQLLVGSLVVQFNSPLQSVDIFYIDQRGERSASLDRFPTR